MARWLGTRGRAAAPYGLALIAVLLIPALLNVIPGIAPGYVLYLVSLALIYAIVAVGLGLLIGYTGQFSLGRAGFFAIGAYASALLTLRLGLPFVVALLVAGSISAAIGFLLGLPALRLSGPYLAVATLGFGLAVPQLVIWQGSWTGGASGLHGLPLASLPLGAFTIVFRTDQDYYYLAAAVLIVLTIFARNVVTSHTGRAFVAIRDSEIAARAMGVDLVRYKTTAFALSALYAGIAGSLYAHLLHGISPEDFTVLLSIDFLTMIVLGGLGSVGGALSGALLLTFLQNALSRLPVVHDFKNLYIVVLGVILILTIAFFPQGLAGIARSARLRCATRTVDRPAGAGQIVELGERSGVR
ncbi:MAG TPA: branched-chain amino acid ABC transporter permease [Candidatus Bathyarchaeia archaeon]|nr:branched-chain amino acid ABC transporter permease [Candidatus Bathyarchaeia archaeon]